MSKLQDEISLVHNEASKDRLLVFFITGNPGLISYYTTFLTLIYSSLRSTHPNLSISVNGTSLAGFELTSSPAQKQRGGGDGPYDLEQQIEHINQTLTSRVGSAPQGGTTRVVLVGHSVGTYILLEVLRRQKALSSSLSSSAAKSEEAMNIISGICLFPTVTHIASSPSGQKFSFLFAIPYFALLVGWLSNALFSRLPTPAMQKLVGAATGFPSEAASVTSAFLQSPGGVRQALYLAGHEMKTITDDKWDDELWGVEKTSSDAGSSGAAVKDEGGVGTKLFFFFGTKDHWVADETRDQLIAARAATSVGEGGEGRPKMEIDETGIPHGFCIKHNEPVAKKVVEYINETLRI